MILPRNRLLWWTGGWLLPLAVLAACVPAPPGMFWTLGALLMLAPIFDAVLAARVLEGVAVRLPDVVRLVRGAPGAVEALVTCPSAGDKPIRLALPLAEELRCAQRDVEVRLPPAGSTCRVSFACLPQRRGRYPLRRCYVGAVSPLGFWLKRRTLAVVSEVRVYPSLLGERRRLAGLFLNRGGYGAHAQRQVGQGREFEQLRDYIRGDAYDEIHWKATAKRARPVTKVFQLERTQEVYVVVDSSRLSARLHDAPAGRSADGAPRTERVTALERYLTAALVMGLVAERQGDLFGVMSFSDRVESFVRARNGKAHYRACREALYALQPREVTPDFGELFSFIRTRLRRRALLVFLTGLDDPILAESFAENVPLVARQHLVLANMLQPGGIAPLFTGPEARTVEDVYRELSGHMQWVRLREVERVLKHRGVQFRLIASEALCPQLVSQYVAVKRRQLL